MKKGIRCIDIHDLDILHWSIQIPILKEGLVDEDFAADIDDGLECEGFRIDYVSLDDAGFISIKFREMLLTKKHAEAVIKVVNQLILKI